MKTTTTITFTLSTLFDLSHASDDFVGTIVQHPANTTDTGRFRIEAAAGGSCMVGQNIDFIGGDLGSTKGGPDTCCGQCKANSACVGYSWTDFQGGTCWLKSNAGSAKIYIGAKGCVLASNTSQSTARFANCDMPGNDQSHIPVTASNFDRCELICLLSPDCKAVTWTDYEGGTCWFKSAVSNCSKYTVATTTVVFNEGH